MAQSSGVDGLTLLILTFIILKLTHVIDWSWWWVLSPLWITGIFILFVIIVMLIFSFLTR